MDNGLKGLMRDIDQTKEGILQYIKPAIVEKVKHSFDNLKTEFEMVSAGIKSMVDMSKLINQRLEHIRELDKNEKL